MKNRIITAAVLFAAMLTGCSIDRGYLNGPDAAAFPSTPAEVEAGLFAAYKGLTLASASDTPFTGIQDNASDIGASRINAANYNGQVQSKLTPTNAWTTKVYDNIYKTVARANLVLDNIDNVKDQMTEQEFNMYKAELLLVRSYLFELGCQLYGDIPYIDHSLGLDAEYVRTPRAEVIAQIIDVDLADELLDALPERHNKEAYGSARIGRAAAYGLKARFCLNWGRFEDAAKYADKAIRLAEGAGYNLDPYDTAFTGEDHDKGEPSPANIFGIGGHKNSNEWLWAMEFNTSISGNQHNAGYYAAPRIAGGCSYFSPTQAFIDAIQCTDGKSIVESPLFDPAAPWKNRDPRLDLFCVRPGSRVLGLEFNTTPTARTILNYNLDPTNGRPVANSEAYGTKSEYGSNGTMGPCGYLWRKYLDIEEYKYNNGFGTGSVCVLSYPLMRMGELYLIRAEANIEWDGGDLALAKSDIEAIRTRASMPGLESSGRDALRSALRYERMVELCNEGFRWFDIRRWGIVDKVTSGIMYAPALDGAPSNARPVIDENWCVTYDGATLSGTTGAMNLRTFMTMTFDPTKDRLWPIPDSERIPNPAVTQNPGYAGYTGN